MLGDDKCEGRIEDRIDPVERSFEVYQSELSSIFQLEDTLFLVFLLLRLRLFGIIGFEN
jgi:hypothetical protein